MRYLAALLAMVLVSFSLLSTPEAKDCPEGYFCLSEEQAVEVAEVLEHHNCMVNAADDGHLQLTLEPNQIVITPEGQVFIEEEITGELQWCDWDLGLKAPTEAIVHRQEPDTQTWGFRLRIRLGAGLMVSHIFNEGRLVEPLLIAEPFFIRDFHALVFGGLTHFGLGAGVDVTRNLNVFGGVGMGYKDADVTPIFGLSLSFN